MRFLKSVALPSGRLVSSVSNPVTTGAVGATVDSDSGLDISGALIDDPTGTVGGTPCVMTSNFRVSMYPQDPGEGLAMPQVLANRVGDVLREVGQPVQAMRLQPPYGAPSGAGAVKMILIDQATPALCSAESVLAKITTCSAGSTRIFGHTRSTGCLRDRTLK
jgi:hypothetical protein